METAALYLRSSKDRHDVSPAAQKRELTELAKSRNLSVIEIFQDAEERADDERRPGFQALLASLKRPDRQWSYLLVMDTARIARNNQHLASVFNWECEKRGVKVLYSKIPETNTIMDVVIRQVIRAFDQLHSLMSKEKGLGGMAENVKQGWRAGGRAPKGYRLEHIATGTMRDGAPVTKSRLVPSTDAHKVRDFLQARAAGVSRRQAMADAGLDGMIDSTLIGMEWNALTYAGHTVWNVHAERIPGGGGYKGGAKRRPREEWVIQHDTHEGLISTEEAEAILARLDTGRARQYRTKGAYLLSGLLVTPQGTAWHGSGDGYYRPAKGRRVPQETIEAAVVATIKSDLVSDAFIRELVAEARRMSAPPPDDRLKPLRDQVAAITAKIGKFADLAAQSEVQRPFLEKINELERQREKQAAELEELETAQKTADVLRAIGEKDVKALLANLADHLQEIDREVLKEMMGGMLEKVELCPTSLQARLHYRFATGDLVASPRGAGDNPILHGSVPFQAPRNRKAA